MNNCLSMNNLCHMKKNEKCLFFVILPQIGLMGTSGDRGIFFTGCPTLKNHILWVFWR